MSTCGLSKSRHRRVHAWPKDLHLRSWLVPLFSVCNEDVLHFEVAVLQRRLRDWRRWTTHCSKNRLAAYRCSKKDIRDFLESWKPLGFSVVVLCTSPAPAEISAKPQRRAVRGTHREPLQPRVLEPEMLRRLEEVIVRLHAENDEILRGAAACMRFTHVQRSRSTSRNRVTVKIFVCRGQSSWCANWACSPVPTPGTETARTAWSLAEHSVSPSAQQG